MRKFYAFLMLLMACVMGVSAQETETLLKGYRKASETPSLVSELHADDVIAIEGRATTNRNWASGAAAWVAANSDGTLPASTAFKLVDAGNGKFYLQQVSTSQYLAKPSNATADVAMTSDVNTAAKLNLVQITGSGNGPSLLGVTSEFAPGSEATKCIRFTNDDPNTFLNCQGSASLPKWRTGTGLWSAYYVYKVTPYSTKSVVVKHMYNGVEKARETVDIKTTFTLDQAVTPYKKKLGGMTATVENGTTLVSDATSEVTITYTQTTALPFEFTPEGATNEQAKWYTMQVRDLYVKYDTELLGSDKDFPLSKDANLNENYQFKFVGDPFGFKIYNKAAGTHALGASAGRTVAGLPEDDRYFNIKESETEFVLHFNQDWGLLIKGTAHNYVNCRFVEVNGEKKYYMSSWNSTGAANDSENRTEIGSRVIFAKADESTLYGNLLNQYRAEVKPKVEALAAITVLFSAEDKAAAIAEIDRTRTVSSESLYNTAKQEIDNAVTAFYATAENKKFILRNRANNRYLSANGTSLSTAHFAPTNAFTLTHAGEGKYNLVTPESKKVQPITHYNTAATAGDNNGETYTLETSGEYVLFHASTATEGSTTQNYLHSNNQPNLVAWTNSNPSQWSLEVVADNDDDYLARAKSILATALNLNGKVLGPNLGQYNYVSQAVKDAVTAAQATDATLATVVAGVDKALNPDGNYATTGESLYALNLPKPGQFIRIKSTKGATKYLSSALVAHTRYSGANVLGLKAEADTSTIFYVEEAGKLVAFDNGKSVVNSYGFLSTGDYGTAPTALVITESAGNTGKYRISLGTERTIYADGDATDNHSDAAGGVKTEDGYRFDLEEVTTLPLSALVYSQEDGKYFGTFYTPVAGTISGGDAEVYYGKVEDDRITLTRVDNNQVAARTAFLVATTTQNAAINFNLGEATPTVAATADNNELVGYTTSVNAANENDYQLSKEEGSFSRVGNYKKRAFRGYLENVSSTAHALAFVLDRTVTRVATAVAETSNAPVFDLAGRRVLQPVKGGIYLQNGKKFIQK